MIKVLKRISRNLVALLKLTRWQTVYRFLGGSIGLVVTTGNDSVWRRPALVIAPHPDDDVFGCGGAIMYHRQTGADVKVIYLTDGKSGTPTGKVDASLVERRESEAKKGLEILGGGDADFWRLADGDMKVTHQQVNQLADAIRSMNEPVIYVPWLADNHPDHQEAFKLAAQAIAKLNGEGISEVWQYEVWTPVISNRVVPLGKFLKRKEQAIEAHQSQMASRAYREGILGLNAYRGMAANIDGSAEAFLALSTEDFLRFIRDLKTF